MVGKLRRWDQKHSPSCRLSLFARTTPSGESRPPNISIRPEIRFSSLSCRFPSCPGRDTRGQQNICRGLLHAASLRQPDVIDFLCEGKTIQRCQSRGTTCFFSRRCRVANFPRTFWRFREKKRFASWLGLDSRSGYFPTFGRSVFATPEKQTA